MQTILKFTKEQSFLQISSEVNRVVWASLQENKDFEVEFRAVKNSKSHKQCAGIHKLCSLLAPRFSEAYGTKFSMEDAKLNIKLHLGYLRTLTMGEAISESLLIKEQMKVWGQKIGKKEWAKILDDCFNDKTPKKPRSFADATKEEMIELIERIHLLAQEMGWDEVKLESVEMQTLVKYYENANT